MNNRLGLGLAVGAGYLLGRTRKLKFAFAVGTFVAGKKLQLSPKALMDFTSSQLQNNPQFKELGDQLREDLRGVGKAATGAIVNRQLGSLADKLHDRTLNVQDRAAGLVPDISSLKDEEEETGDGSEAEEREEPRREARKKSAPSGSSSAGSRTAKKATGSARSAGQGAAKRTASGGARKTASGTSGTAKKTASGATGAAKKTAARRTSAAKGGRSRG
ncbi:DNA primase [Streptomyces sp. NPDC021093]|uniref:DNA primase n=1 Tax=Streptomyces sp. NPDC021093 TaxID=3365112 RepID=UPI0037AC8BAD